MVRKTNIIAAGVTLLLAGAQGAYALTNAEAGVEAAPVVDCVAKGGQEILITFSDLGDAFVFDLDPIQNGRVQVLTKDRQAPTDIWRAEIHEVKANSPGKSKSGKGSLTEYAGKVTKGVKVGRLYQTVITTDAVPAGLPAEMNVCIIGPVAVFPLTE